MASVLRTLFDSIRCDGINARISAVTNLSTGSRSVDQVLIENQDTLIPFGRTSSGAERVEVDFHARLLPLDALRVGRP
jgi:hypothetical protein